MTPEIGKWYKILAFSKKTEYYIKYKYHNLSTNDCFIYEWISPEDNYYCASGGFTNIEFIEEVDAIAYLPNNHPDKIKSYEIY